MANTSVSTSVATESGPRDCKVFGRSRGLCVTAGIGACAGRYVVTHEASGSALSIPFVTLGAAKVAMRLLATHADWTHEEATIQMRRKPHEVARACLEAVGSNGKETLAWFQGVVADNFRPDTRPQWLAKAEGR